MNEEIEFETIQAKRLLELIGGLDTFFKFQSENNIDVICGEDYQYLCYINKECYASGLTFAFALMYGICLYLGIETKPQKI